MQQCQNNVEIYLQKINRLVLSLESRNLALPHRFIAALILNNLSSDFDYLVTAITQDFRLDKEIDLKNLYNQIIDESRRQKAIKNSSSSSHRNSSNSSSNLNSSY